MSDGKKSLITEKDIDKRFGLFAGEEEADGLPTAEEELLETYPSGQARREAGERKRKPDAQPRDTAESAQPGDRPAASVRLEGNPVEPDQPYDDPVRSERGPAAPDQPEDDSVGPHSIRLIGDRGPRGDGNGRPERDA